MPMHLERFPEQVRAVHNDDVCDQQDPVKLELNTPVVEKKNHVPLKQQQRRQTPRRRVVRFDLEQTCVIKSQEEHQQRQEQQDQDDNGDEDGAPTTMWYTMEEIEKMEESCHKMARKVIQREIRQRNGLCSYSQVILCLHKTSCNTRAQKQGGGSSSLLHIQDGSASANTPFLLDLATKYVGLERYIVRKVERSAQKSLLQSIDFLCHCQDEDSPFEVCPDYIRQGCEAISLPHRQFALIMAQALSLSLSIDPTTATPTAPTRMEI